MFMFTKVLISKELSMYMLRISNILNILQIQKGPLFDVRFSHLLQQQIFYRRTFPLLNLLKQVGSTFLLVEFYSIVQTKNLHPMTQVRRNTSNNMRLELMSLNFFAFLWSSIFVLGPLTNLRAIDIRKFMPSSEYASQNHQVEVDCFHKVSGLQIQPCHPASHHMLARSVCT